MSKFNILRHIPSAISKIHKQILPTKAHGSWITDIHNNRYLDLTSGIGALSTGHSHPYVINQVKKQLTKLVHIPQQVFQSHPPQIALTNKLLDIIEKIKKEVEESKKTFQKYEWPSIDVTRKSVEETAASVIKIHEIRNQND